MATKDRLHPESPIADEQMIRKVYEALETCPDVDASRVVVMAQGGHLTLEGNVDMFWQRSCVEYIAQRQPGVDVVENHLTVVPTESVDDEQLASQIVSAITREAKCNVEDVHIKVCNGVVTLCGTVPDEAVRQSLETPVHRMNGVTDIVNHMIVGEHTSGHQTPA